MISNDYNIITEINIGLGRFHQISKEGANHIQSFIDSIAKEMLFSAGDMKLRENEECLLFEDEKKFKAKNIYSAIFSDIKKDKGIVYFTPKFDVSDNSDLTNETLEIEGETFYYGKVTLGKQTVLYILRWDTEKHIQSKN